MADNDILNVDVDNFDDFELPPLPKLPPKKMQDELAEAPEAGDIDRELPAMPLKTVDNSLDEINDIPDEDDLPQAVSDEAGSDEVAQIDDFDLPPLPEIKKAEERPDDEVFEFEETEPEPDTVTDARFDIEDEYDGIIDEPETDEIIVDEATALAPLTTGKDAYARNIKESVRLNDMAMEIKNKPVLDDLSNEYAAPKKKAESLVDRDKLDDDEKRVLKQRLEEDLSKRPENFNARASQNMYNRLMEEKKLKIAKKGFMISIIPIIMGLASAVISYTSLNWGDYLWFQYVAMFMVLAALLLFAKSKHIKMLSTSMYAVCLLLYVGPGLVLFALDEKMQQASDSIVHLLLAIAAAALNIISIIILTKNEAVNIYYSTKFSRKR